MIISFDRKEEAMGYKVSWGIGDGWLRNVGEYALPHHYLDSRWILFHDGVSY
jgi:hypothetical protein